MTPTSLAIGVLLFDLAEGRQVSLGPAAPPVLIELDSKVVARHSQHRGAQSHRHRNAHRVAASHLAVPPPVFTGTADDRVADFENAVAPSLFRSYPSVLPKSEVGAPAVETVEAEYRYTAPEAKLEPLPLSLDDPVKNPEADRQKMLQAFKDSIGEAASPKFADQTVQAELRKFTVVCTKFVHLHCCSPVFFFLPFFVSVWNYWARFLEVKQMQKLVVSSHQKAFSRRAPYRDLQAVYRCSPMLTLT